MSSSSRPQPISAMTEEELINLTNALSLAMDNGEDPGSDIEITRHDAEQTDITVGGKRISVMFERSTATPIPIHSRGPRDSFYGPPNPLGSHPHPPPPRSPSPTHTPPRSPRPAPPPSTPSTCRDASGLTIDEWVALFPCPPAPPPSSPSYGPFPPHESLPPKWFKHVRFSLTPEQIQQQPTPKPRLRESSIITTSSLFDENDDDPRAKCVKFCLTQEQIQREGEQHERLVESEILDVDVEQFVECEIEMGKIGVLKSVLKHVLRRGGRGEAVKVFKVKRG